MDKVRVIATSAVTWLTLAMLIGQAALAELANAGFEDGWSETAASWIGRAVAVAAGIIGVIRRVTPVDESEYGLT